MNKVLRGMLYFLVGLLNARAGIAFLSLLLPMSLGLWTGNIIHLRMNARVFQNIVMVVLTLMGVKLMISV